MVVKCQPTSNYGLPRAGISNAGVPFMNIQMTCLMCICYPFLISNELYSEHYDPFF